MSQTLYCNRYTSEEKIENSDVIIFWGKDHDEAYVNVIEGKQIIVIDPVRTDIAQTADLYIPINAGYDLYLALLLNRFAIIEGLHNEEYLADFAPDYEDFYELTQSVRVKATLEILGLSLGEIGSILEMIKEKKTIIVVGASVLDHPNGADTLRTIDAFGMILGLFDKERLESPVVCTKSSMIDGFDGDIFEFIDEIERLVR